MDPLNKFYTDLEEPNQSCFLALREIILNFDPEITEHWKYRLPFFYYKNKPFCYLWRDKITQTPYIGICRGNQIDHSQLEQGNRRKMKVYYIDPKKDIPVEEIYNVFNLAKEKYM